MGNILGLFLVLAVYVLIYNLAMYVIARIYGVRVDEFYVGLNPGFSLYKTKINNTEFGLGWLPLGGYVKFSGMILEEDEEILPHHFQHLSLAKQITILIAGPLSNLILGLIAYIYFNDSEWFGLGSVLAVLTLAMLGNFLLFKLAPSFIKRKQERTKVEELLLYFFSLVLYIGSLLAITIFVNKAFPLNELISYILSGEFSYKSFYQDFSIQNMKVYASHAGILFFFMNLLPLGGLIGLFILNTMYRALSGAKMSDKLEELIALITAPILLFLLGWWIYLIW